MKKLAVITVLGATLMLGACVMKSPSSSAGFEVCEGKQCWNQVNVVYRCGITGNRSQLNARYILDKNNIVAVKIQHGKKDYGTLRRLANKTTMHVFRDGDLAWVVDPVSPYELEKTDGGMLTLDTEAVVNGKKVGVTLIQAKYCVVNPEATAQFANQK